MDIWRTHTAAPFQTPPTPQGVAVSPWPCAGGGVLSKALYGWYGPGGVVDRPDRSHRDAAGYAKALFGDGHSRVVAFGWKTPRPGEGAEGRPQLVVAAVRDMLTVGTQHRNPHTLWLLVSQDGEALVVQANRSALGMAPARLFADGPKGTRLWRRCFQWGHAVAHRAQHDGDVATQAWPTTWMGWVRAPRALHALARLHPVALALARQGVPGHPHYPDLRTLGHWMGGDNGRTLDNHTRDLCKEVLRTLATLIPPELAVDTVRLHAAALQPDGTSTPPRLVFACTNGGFFAHAGMDRLFAALAAPPVQPALVRGSGAACAHAHVPTTHLHLSTPHALGPELVGVRLPGAVSSAHAHMARAALAAHTAQEVLGAPPTAQGFVPLVRG